MKEELIEHIKKVVGELHIDIRMEVVAWYMQSIGIDADDIMISPAGLFDRKHERDIQKISVLETNSNREFAQIIVSREGIYNSLPQAITHSAKRSRGSIKTTSEMVQEVRVGREEERAARLFFQPFENEFYHQLVTLEVEEQNILKGFSSDSRYSKMLDTFWNLPDYLNQRQKAIFTYLIPVIHRIAGNLDQIKLLYEIIIKQTVNFIITAPEVLNVTNPFSIGSKNQTLGRNIILGDSFSLNRRTLEIQIGPLAEEKIFEYLPDESGRKVLEFLNSYFIPVDVNVDVKIIPAGCRKLHLSAESEPCHLGYNLVI